MDANQFLWQGKLNNSFNWDIDKDIDVMPKFNAQSR